MKTVKGLYSGNYYTGGLQEGREMELDSKNHHDTKVTVVFQEHLYNGK